MAKDDDLIADLHARPGRKERETLLADYFTRCRPRLYAMVELRLERRLRRRLSPSDVIQDAFIEAARLLPAYIAAPRLPPFLWVRRVVADKLHDLHRRHRGARRRDVRREENPEPGAAGPAASSDVLARRLAADVTSPSHDAAETESLKPLTAALERLEAIDHEIIALRAFEGLSGADAARVLGIEPAAARQRYVRALERLRGLLARRGGAGEAE